jgi:hypothetical protein
MLLRMLGSSSGAEAEFGMRLTPETIESAIDQHKQHLLLWQAEQPDDFAAFQQRIETRRKLFGVKAQGK